MKVVGQIRFDGIVGIGYIAEEYEKDSGDE